MKKVMNWGQVYGGLSYEEWLVYVREIRDELNKMRQEMREVSNRAFSLAS